MQAAIDRFFFAWSQTDPDARHEAIASALSDTAIYSDPRSDGRLSGLDVISEYVGNFTAGAAGWAAVVDSVDEINGYAKVIVSFGGPGPDGTNMTQQGTYLVEADESGALILLAGFVGP